MGAFKSLGHAFASVAKDIVTGARAIVSVIGKLQGIAPAIEAVTGLVDPAAVQYERLAFGLLGSAVQAAQSVDAAASSDFLQIPADAAMIAELKAAGSTLLVELAKLGITTAAPTPASSAAPATAATTAAVAQ